MRLKDVVELSKVHVIQYIKKHTEDITKILTAEHHDLITKLRKWIEISEMYMEKCAEFQKRTLTAEMYSALTNPVLEAEYALDDNNPLSLYDCVACTIRNTNKYMSPYDCFDLETIQNWRTVAQENEELK